MGNFKKSKKGAKRLSVTAGGLGGAASPPPPSEVGGAALENFQNLALKTATAVFSESI